MSSLEDRDKSKSGTDECLYCYGTGCGKLDCPARKKKNDQAGSCEDAHQSSGSQNWPSSSSSKFASSLTSNNNQPALSIEQFERAVKIMAEVESDFFGRSPLESGMYLPSSRKEDRDMSKSGRDECLYYNEAGFWNADCLTMKKENDRTRRSDTSDNESIQSGGCRLSAQKLMQHSYKAFQPSSSLSRPVSSLIAEKNKPALSIDRYENMVNTMAEVESDQFGRSPLESGMYQPSPQKGDTGLDTVLSTLKILSYNVWFQDLEIDKRMEALGDIIQLHSPDIMCFQEITPYIYDIFKQSSWWKGYNCSISYEMARTRRYFCMQLSKLPVKFFSRKLFSNTKMLRELCMLEIEDGGKPLIVATSHLESPCPAPPKWDQMHSEERVAQAKEAINLLAKSPNVVFGGDMNWDEDLDGQFPLSDGWVDAWAELRPGENGWTYDTRSNPMLSANRPLQKRLDRFICNLHDFKLNAIDMIGMEAIPGLSYCKEKRVRKRVQRLMLPVLPSDHYGLLLKVSSQ